MLVQQTIKSLHLIRKTCIMKKVIFFLSMALLVSCVQTKDYTPNLAEAPSNLRIFNQSNEPVDLSLYNPGGKDAKSVYVFSVAPSKSYSIESVKQFDSLRVTFYDETVLRLYFVSPKNSGSLSFLDYAETSQDKDFYFLNIDYNLKALAK